MGIITRLIPHYTQPQEAAGIDASNQLARGLVDVFNPLSLTNKTSIRGYTPSVSDGVITGGVGRLGRNIILPAGTANSGLIIADDGDALFPSSTDATIFVVRRSIDTTARNSSLFGYNASSTDRVLCHAPYGDGVMYFDFGSTATANRLSVAYTKSTNIDYLVFVAGGGKGREIWRNGVKIAGDATKTGTRPATAANFRIGSSGGAGPVLSDSEEVYLFGVANRAWSDTEIRSWSSNPWQIFKPRKRQIYVNTATGAQNLTPSLYADGDTFYTPTVAPGAVNLAPSLYTDADTFYAATVAASYNLQPAAFADSDAFYAATVSPGAATISPSLFVDGDTLYTATVTGGDVAIVTPEQITYAPPRKTRAPNFAPRKLAIEPEAKKKPKAKAGAKEEKPSINRLRVVNDLIPPDSMFVLMEKRRQQEIELQEISRLIMYNIRARAALLAA